MTSNQKNWSVFLATTVVSTLFYSAYLAAVGVTEENILTVLHWSARASFLLLMVVFVARPLQQLLKQPWTANLLRNRRAALSSTRFCQRTTTIRLTFDRTIRPGKRLPRQRGVLRPK